MVHARRILDASHLNAEMLYIFLMDHPAGSESQDLGSDGMVAYVANGLASQCNFLYHPESSEPWERVESTGRIPITVPRKRRV